MWGGRYFTIRQTVLKSQPEWLLQNKKLMDDVFFSQYVHFSMSKFINNTTRTIFISYVIKKVLSKLIQEAKVLIKK
ncbi:MAG: hypothetical protein CVU09_09215 [Bacteroidetes bacterium HGW-Bacteroidetes-4]|nr:MAG: hypothetical protein CVU09_09215 [Bacteroidetes bacterium HGW-Bacteroidetes-4]